MENKNEQQVPEIMPEPIEEPKKSKKGQMAKGVACGNDFSWICRTERGH